MSATEVATADTVSLRDSQVRSHVYGVLARSFTYPNQELVTVLLKRGALLDLLWGLGSILMTPPSSLVETGEWVSRHDTSVLLEELSVDYTRLFVTGVPRVIAPPYESVYLDQGLLMGESVSKVVSAYREAGLGIQDNYDDLPDHLSAELEFMQYLTRAEKSAAERGDAESLGSWGERQSRFLSEHLGRWAPGCLGKVSSGAETPFYRLIAGIALKFLEWDAARLAAPASLVATEDN